MFSTKNIIIAVLALIVLYLLYRQSTAKKCTCTSTTTAPGGSNLSTYSSGAGAGLSGLSVSGGGLSGSGLNVINAGGLDQLASSAGLSGALAAEKYAMN